MSLVSVLVAVAIAGIVALVMSEQIKNGFSGQKAVELRGSAESIRRSIEGSIDCEATLASAGINSKNFASKCSSSSATNGMKAPWLRLMRRTSSGKSIAMTGSLDSDGSADLGDWKIRTSCSSAEDSLVVRLARIAPDGSDAKDPLTGKSLGWYSERALVFGGDAIPICTNFGSGKANYKAISVYKRPTQSMLTMTVPSWAKRVVIHYDANYISTSSNNTPGYASDWVSEDKTTARVVIDLAAGVSTGTGTHTGGRGPTATLAYGWNGIPNGQVIRPQIGDRTCGEFCDGSAYFLVFRPKVLFDSTSRKLTFKGMYAGPWGEQGVALIEFFND